MDFIRNDDYCFGIDKKKRDRTEQDKIRDKTKQLTDLSRLIIIGFHYFHVEGLCLPSVNFVRNDKIIEFKKVLKLVKTNF